MRMSIAIAATMLVILPATAQEKLKEVDIQSAFGQAAELDRTGLARKTKLVDVRPAKPGEIVVTVIAGEGKETESPPAGNGDMVVRNRCPETGNEEILVTAERFAERYEGPSGASDDGWTPYRPRGVEMRYYIVSEEDGSFTFTAPWGSPMVARPGDAIVQNPTEPTDTYRIAAQAFACTYEILEPAG